MRFYKQTEFSKTLFFTSKFVDARFAKTNADFYFGRDTPDAWSRPEKFGLNFQIPLTFHDLGLGIFVFYDEEYEGDYDQIEVRLLILNMRFKWLRKSQW